MTASEPSEVQGRSVIRWGFKSKKQLPLFMIWREDRNSLGEVEHASVIFTTHRLLRQLRTLLSSTRKDERA